MKVMNGTDPNTKYFRQMLEQGKKLHETGGTKPGWNHPTATGVLQPMDEGGPHPIGAHQSAGLL